mmetsp:Transcript_24056/g.75372  ORF Transcript_24056/g.75372 Transcript_24056/m.75372 type:complete len:270 (-) Transcript_24056:39-848(-)
MCLRAFRILRMFWPILLVLQHVDGGVLRNYEEHRVAPAAELIHLGRARRPLECPSLHEPVDLGRGPDNPLRQPLDEHTSLAVFSYVHVGPLGLQKVGYHFVVYLEVSCPDEVLAACRRVVLDVCKYIFDGARDNAPLSLRLPPLHGVGLACAGLPICDYGGIVPLERGQYGTLRRQLVHGALLAVLVVHVVKRELMSSVDERIAGYRPARVTESCQVLGHRQNSIRWIDEHRVLVVLRPLKLPLKRRPHPDDDLEIAPIFRKRLELVIV